MKVRGKLAIICMAMALVLCACGGLFTTEEEKGARAYCDDMMRSLQEGSWETLLSMLPMLNSEPGIPSVLLMIPVGFHGLLFAKQTIFSGNSGDKRMISLQIRQRIQQRPATKAHQTQD